MSEAAGLQREGRVEAAPWTARMIHPLSDRGVGQPGSFVRKTFNIDKPTGRETLRISAMGLYRAFINGKRVGNDLLTPGWTAYDKRLAYQTYNVGDLLAAGDNVIEIWLADGWFRSRLMWPDSPISNSWGDDIAAIAELRAGPEANSPLLVATDTSWQSGETPVRKSGIYFGEIYDARVPLEATAGTEALSYDTSVLIPQEITPIREMAPFVPFRSWTDAECRTIHDFGQNTAGFVAFTVEGEPGVRVIVEHSEIIDRDGVFDNRNYRSAEARVEYTLAGNGAESYRPIFTFFGFRFARITVEGQARLTKVELVPITSLPVATAGFESGHPLVDRLVMNTIWSQRSNFVEVPTDCPQRDERLGWTGDAQVFANAACYLGDSGEFLRKFLRDMMADQREDGAIPHVTPDPTRLRASERGFAGSTGWGDAITVIPWTLYLHYGDKGVLAETLPAMVKWIDFVWSISGGPIPRPPRHMGERGFTFGDWLQPKGSTTKPLPTVSDDCAATIYLYISANLAARAAAIVGDEEVARRMSDVAMTVKAAFQREFITPGGRVGSDDQTSYALAILHDLIPPALLPAARANFVNAVRRTDGRIGTGFIGTPALLPALAKIGEPALAAAVFLQEEVPGWLYQVKNGATTIWERWDAIQADGTIFAPEMNSYNHYAYGAVCAWLFEAVAGFRPDEAEPGFRHIIFEPLVIPALGHVQAYHDSPAGRIDAGWTLDGNLANYTISIPVGSIGTFVLAPQNIEASVDGNPLNEIAGGKVRAPLGAGQHTITFRIGNGGNGGR